MQGHVPYITLLMLQFLFLFVELHADHKTDTILRCESSLP